MLNFYVNSVEICFFAGISHHFMFQSQSVCVQNDVLRCVFFVFGFILKHTENLP